MYKVTSRGIEELGEPIELTFEDKLDIQDILNESSMLLNTSKDNGKWSQNTAYVYEKADSYTFGANDVFVYERDEEDDD